MIQARDYTADFSERKTARKELKLKPSVAEKIKFAASLTGMDVSTFISSAAYEKAQQIEQAQFATVLQDMEFDAFAAAVERTEKRNNTLAGIIDKSREMLVDA